ncbi:hypothetical protein GALL_48290 [mine drainage metagenome]|uniref:Tetratricopeptide repeat protein n=1 Tax=mine drainage metagenome TaxID=410659 RepID=A0A1J5TKX1_9ZZZZ
MNAALEKVLYHLTQKSNLTDISVDDLSHLAKNYPFFAPAQLALAVKLKQDNDFESQTQLQKTALYFSNLNWLQYQLMNGEAKNFRPSEINTSSSATGSPAAPATAEEIKPEPVREENKISEEYKAFVPNIQETADVADDKQEKVVEAHKTFAPPINEIIAADDEQEKTDEKNIAPVQRTEIIEPPGSIDLKIPSNNKTIRQPDTLPPSFSGNFAKNIFDPAVNQMDKYSSLLSAQLSDFKKPVAENAKLDFEMEPYYTIDYFASQGIKVDLTKQPHDKLTKQLLSFTDWLKKMKTVSPNPQDLGTDPELEKAIQGIAQTSNEAKEIATETMAEVFVKQGKIDKAVQLYIKLSFLDPEKSSYFAAKIQQLKGM